MLSDLYAGFGPDLKMLLQRLDLEKYLSCFDDEEIDLQVFLHMSEAELDDQDTQRPQETHASHIRSALYMMSM